MYKLSCTCGQNPREKIVYMVKVFLPYTKQVSFKSCLALICNSVIKRTVDGQVQKIYCKKLFNLFDKIISMHNL